MYFQKIILHLFTSEEFEERQLHAYQYFFDKHYKTRAKDANLDLDCNRFRKFEDSSASCPWPALKATTKDSFKPVYTLDKERSVGQTKKIYNPVLFFTVNTMFGWVPQITGQSKVGYRQACILFRIPSPWWGGEIIKGFEEREGKGRRKKKKTWGKYNFWQ